MEDLNPSQVSEPIEVRCHHEHPESEQRESIIADDFEGGFSRALANRELAIQGISNPDGNQKAEEVSVEEFGIIGKIQFL